MHVFILTAPTHLTIFIRGLPNLLFSIIVKYTFLVSKGLLCLYDKQNNIWLLVDMKFLFSRSTWHFTRLLRLLVSYRVKCSKRNSISTCTHILFSIWLSSLHYCKQIKNVNWFSSLRKFALFSWECTTMYQSHWKDVGLVEKVVVLQMKRFTLS